MNNQVHLSTFTLDELTTQISDIVEKKVFGLLKDSAKPSDTEWITRKEAAKMLGVSLPTIHAWIKSGKITAYRINTRIRFKKSELQDSLKQIKTSI